MVGQGHLGVGYQTRMGFQTQDEVTIRGGAPNKGWGSRQGWISSHGVGFQTGDGVADRMGF